MHTLHRVTFDVGANEAILATLSRSLYLMFGESFEFKSNGSSEGSDMYFRVIRRILGFKSDELRAKVRVEVE